MRRSLVHLLTLLGILIILIIGAWWHIVEWWRSLTTLKKSVYAVLALAFAALIVSRFF